MITRIIVIMIMIVTLVNIVIVVILIIGFSTTSARGAPVDEVDAKI